MLLQFPGPSREDVRLGFISEIETIMGQSHIKSTCCRCKICLDLVILLRGKLVNFIFEDKLYAIFFDKQRQFVCSFRQCFLLEVTYED